MSGYENYLANRWEKMNEVVTAYCVECDAACDYVSPDDAPNWICGDCYDRINCATCNGTTQIGAPWAPDSCPDCDRRPALTDPKPF